MTTDGGRTAQHVPFDDFMRSRAGQSLRRYVDKLAGGYGLADDVWQDVQCYAWEHWTTFNDEDHVVNACRRKAQTSLIDQLRAFGPARVELCDEFSADALGEAPDPQDLLLGYEDRRARWLAFGRLPAKKRALLLDHAHADGQYEVLAVARGKSVGAMRVQVFRARQALRDATVHGPAAALAPILPITLALAKTGRAVRRAIANLARPTTVAGRVVVGLTVVSTAITPWPGRLDTVKPALSETVAASEGRHSVGPRLVAEMAVTDVRVPLAPSSVPETSGDDPQPSASPRPSPTCLADLACLRPDDGPPGGDPNRKLGEEVCAKAIGRCVSQRAVGGACPYMADVPREVATCEHYSDTYTTLPPRPGETPTPSPAPAPGGFR